MSYGSRLTFAASLVEKSRQSCFARRKLRRQTRETGCWSWQTSQSGMRRGDGEERRILSSPRGILPKKKPAQLSGLSNINSVLLVVATVARLAALGKHFAGAFREFLRLGQEVERTDHLRVTLGTGLHAFLLAEL